MQHVSQPINHTQQQRWLCLDYIDESNLKCGLFTAWILCGMCASKLKTRPANKSFMPSKSLKCNLVLTHWRRLTTWDYHLGSASKTYNIWGLMKTCSKANTAGGGFKETCRLQIHVCASVSSLQRRSGAGTLAEPSGVLREARFRNLKKVQTVNLSILCLICLFSILLAWMHFYFSCNGANAITKLALSKRLMLWAFQGKTNSTLRH